jgi:hypothetical protein
MKFGHLKPGDKVTRLLCGISMLMTVREVREDVLVCDTEDCAGGWTFDMNTGVEEDEDLGWGVKFGVTGSVLIPSQKMN